jgi:hypothetical protein
MMMTYLIIYLVLLYILFGAALKVIDDYVHEDPVPLFVFVLAWPIALFAWAVDYIIERFVR